MTCTSARIHRTRAQLHGFFASLEGTTDASRALDSIDDDVRLRTTYGDVHGRAELFAALTHSRPGARSSHELRRFVADASRDDRTIAKFEVVRHVRASDGAHEVASLDYEVVATESEGHEPRIVSMDVRSADDPSSIDMSFRDSFAEHRALATLYRWLALHDEATADAESFREILRLDGMRLAPRPNAPELTTARAFDAYLARRRDFFRESRHTVNLAKVAEGTDGTYTLRALVSFSGVTSDNQPASERTEHRWVLRETGERYARIESIRTDAVIPFALRADSERP